MAAQIQQRKSPITNILELPRELFFKIFSYIRNDEDILSIALTCRLFKEAMTDEFKHRNLMKLNAKIEKLENITDPDKRELKLICKLSEIVLKFYKIHGNLERSLTILASFNEEGSQDFSLYQLFKEMLQKNEVEQAIKTARHIFNKNLQLSCLREGIYQYLDQKNYEQAKIAANYIDNEKARINILRFIESSRKIKKSLV